MGAREAGDLEGFSSDRLPLIKLACKETKVCQAIDGGQRVEIEKRQVAVIVWCKADIKSIDTGTEVTEPP